MTARLGVDGEDVFASQCDRQIGIGVVGERVLDGAGGCAGVEIAVGQVRLVVRQQAAVNIKCAIEAALKEALRLRCRWMEIQRLQRADLGKNAHQECEDAGAEARLFVIAAPIFAVAGLRKVVDELAFRDLRLGLPQYTARSTLLKTSFNSRP